MSSNMTERSLRTRDPTKPKKKPRERIILIDDEIPTINYRVNPSTHVLKILKHVLANKNINANDDGMKGLELAILDSNRDKIQNFDPTTKISELVKSTNFLPLQGGAG